MKTEQPTPKPRETTPPVSSPEPPSSFRTLDGEIELEIMLKRAWGIHPPGFTRPLLTEARARGKKP